MVSRPNSSAGVTAPSKTKPALKYTELNHIGDDKKYFKVKFKDGDTTQVWSFALLPSVEAALQYGPNGNMKGNVTTPEVKPGLLNSTTAKYKNSLVPGGTPIIQGVGIQATTRQIIGLFIGTETLNESDTAYPSLNTIYRVDSVGDYKEDGLPYSKFTNAVSKAVDFDKKVVQQMKVVEIDINSDVPFKDECVIVNFKYYLRSGNRVYYVMDLLSTKYTGDA